MNAEIIKALLTEIRKCSVRIGTGPFCDLCYSHVVGKPDNIILSCMWTGTEGEEYQVNFNEGNFATAKIGGSVITLNDDSGEATFIELFDIVPHQIITNFN